MEHKIRTALIVNPASGTVSKHKIIPKILKRLEKIGFETEVFATEGPGHATQLAKTAISNNFGAVLACGGDGTVNETARGMLGTGIPMGIIPTGSGNGLARHLGIPVDIERSLRVIEERHLTCADYGTANDTPFFCTFGVGFDAAVSERCARQKRRGLMMYLKNAIDEYARFSPETYTIEANGKTISNRAFLVVVCNASQYGNNAFIAPEASVTDGELDVTIVHTGNLFEQAILGVDFITGFIGKNALIDSFRARNVRITRQGHGAAHIDGDPIVMPDVIDVRCHPAQITIFSPTKETRFRPILTPAALFFRDVGLSISRLWRKV